MSESSFLGLVHNATLLLAMAVIFDISARHYPLPGRKTGPWPGRFHELTLGLLLGAIGLAVMLSPWEFSPGIIFDTRSVLLGISGLFFGLVPTAIAMAITATYRVYLGGAATVPGVCVILATGIIGIAWRQVHRRPLAEVSWRELFVFGLVIHLVMLGLMLILPWSAAVQVLANISLPVLTIYPLGTALLGGLLANRLRREQHSRALLESEERHRSILAASPDDITITDLEGCIRMVSPAALSMFNCQRDEELLGHPVTDFIVPADRERVMANVARMFQGVMPGPGEYRGLRVDGSTFDMEVNGEFIRNADGHPGSMVFIVRDITARKQAEAELRQRDRDLQARNDELIRFTYTVSHDLKSPLVTISAFLGYLEKDLQKPDPAAVAKDLGYIRNAAAKMSKLLDELLVLSRVGRVQTPSVDVPLQTVVQEALALVAGRITQRGVTVEVTAAPLLLHGDHARLVEVFQNLLDNACKFMGSQPTPRIEIGVEEMAGERVIVVRDNGIGIDPRYLAKVFGLFEKLDPETVGTGIGLALVKRIVEVHGGRIWVESEGLGQGTTFRFTLAPGAVKNLTLGIGSL